MRLVVYSTYLLTLVAVPMSAGVITFDSLNDGDTVTNQYVGQGVAFQGAIALTVGVSLNELEFPPRSNFNVISDNGGPLTIFFSTPQPSLFVYFTYTQSLTLQAFDSSNVLLGSVTSAAACASNLALSGSPGCSPNEQISINSLGPISSVRIAGNPAGGSFVLDDLNFPIDVVGTPEPSTYAMMVLGLGCFLLFPRRRKA